MRIELKDPRWFPWDQAITISDEKKEKWIELGLNYIKQEAAKENPNYPIEYEILSGDTKIYIWLNDPTTAINIHVMKMVSSFTGVIKLEDL